MRKLILAGLLITITSFLFAQELDSIITSTEAGRIVKILASDDMQGRKVFTPGINKAADFIAREFKAAGLKTLPGNKSFFQKFIALEPVNYSVKGTINGDKLVERNMLAVTSFSKLTVNENSKYEIVQIKKGERLTTSAGFYLRKQKNLIVLVDTSFAERFNLLSRYNKGMFKAKHSVIFVLTDKIPVTYSFEVKQQLKETTLFNIAGIIPGKSKKQEYVIFSGHYDHLGMGKPNAEKDSIFNGANDDASGIAAVILLAKYFAQQKNNERTLIFTAFTGEETGMAFGSTYFSRVVDADKVTAMFNIEMIGTESKWGARSAFITGFERSNMGQILQRNLEGTNFTFYPDPYLQQQLFFRSDNATLARLGVPAHTISTSKMDEEKYYHTVEDEIETLDIENMAEIIKAIALSSQSIIKNKDTPSRVVLSEMEK